MTESLRKRAANYLNQTGSATHAGEVAVEAVLVNDQGKWLACHRIPAEGAAAPREADPLAYTAVKMAK
jgi:hypothetical protein